MRLDEVAAKIGAEVVGDGSQEVTGCNTLADAASGQLGFLANPKYAKQLETTRASAVVVGPSVNATWVTLLKARDPYYAFRQAVVLLHGFRRHPHAGVHPRAHVEPTAAVGEGTVIYPGVYVGANARIGRDCILYPNVTVYENCVLGDRVTIHAGTVIGEDGYGYATHRGEHHKFPTLGNVVVEDDVEIGANCAIDSATFGSTVIGRGTKTSNLVTVGHNSRVGAHGLLVAQVGIAGSTSLGHHATVAGQVGIAGHLKIGDGVTIGAKSGVMNDVPDQSTVLGQPAMPAAEARRVYTIFTKLPELQERVKKLEEAAGGRGGQSDLEDLL